MTTPKLIRIAVLASGDGSNFEAITMATREGRLQAEVVGLLSNRPGVRVLERASRLQVQAAVLKSKDFASLLEWNQAVLNQLKSWQTEWVVLAGFTGLIGPLVLESYPARVVNSHPSLLPKYGGKGMYGERVHTAVLQGKEKESGITIHLLNERFDEGPIVAQKRVPVDITDTPATLAARVQTAERKFYPEVLQDLLTGRIKSR